MGPLPGEAQESSWKGALVGNCKSKISTLLPKVTAGEEGLEICLPDNIMDNIASSLHLCLVGRFLAFIPTIDMVRRWVGSKWKIKGSVSNSVMSGGLFLFRFTAEEDFVYIMSSSWSYGKHCLALSKWKSGFDPNTDLLRLAPVWITLSGLPLEFWDDIIFRWIGNSFGQFVVVDNVTMQKSRLVYAHLCVNVVINNALPNFIALKSKWGKWTQAIVYENASLYCQRCGKHGHVIADCLTPQPPEEKLKEKLSSTVTPDSKKVPSPSRRFLGPELKEGEIPQAKIEQEGLKEEASLNDKKGHNESTPLVIMQLIPNSVGSCGRSIWSTGVEASPTIGIGLDPTSSSSATSSTGDITTLSHGNRFASSSPADKEKGEWQEPKRKT
ncbi:uncharacterized protein LOC131857021 [Cryptomeria japonica]|uniref:uncharacterized protein LOC131857021 n=1 Tax=Cryptomeria japonica TaxID=3369 RepID=UPI0027DA9588|nr:uncharacterized protein LOC131857021 [Cryptomeria japonica]